MPANTGDATLALTASRTGVTTWAANGNAAPTVATVTTTGAVSRVENLDSSQVFTVTAVAKVTFSQSIDPAHHPLTYGWVTGQNKLDANKHAAGTETLSLLANPYTTVAASLANTLVEEQADEPSHTQTEG